MSRIGMCGGAYASQSLSADAQSCVNLYLEKNESGAAKSELSLYPTAGLSLTGGYQLPDSPVRGEWMVATPGVIPRGFAIAGSTLFELFDVGNVVGTVANGGVINRGAVANDGKPASFASSNIQLMIASGGQGYCLTLATNVLTGPIATIAGAVQVGYQDGFFCALKGNSAQFFLSNLLDGTTWDAGQTAIISVFPDNVVSLVVDHRELCFLGWKQSVCYYNSGAVFADDVIPGSFVEQGSAATFGVAQIDNTVFWIGQSTHGNRIAWRAQQYTPTRISTHAIEFAWQGYSRVDDAVAYPFQDQGHSFIQWFFPSANGGKGATWVFDVATGSWHERVFGTGETATAHRSCCHMFAFGRHLVGDWASGNVYQMNIPKSDGAGGWLFATDFGNPIRRVRRSPYIGMAGVWNFFKSLEIMAEPGLGPEIPLTDGAGNPRDPQLMLRWSNDGGKSWVDYPSPLNLGQVGKYKTRMLARRLGRVWGSIGRIFEIAFSDPVPLRVIDADLDAVPDMGPQKRLAQKLREQS